MWRPSSRKMTSHGPERMEAHPPVDVGIPMPADIEGEERAALPAPGTGGPLRPRPLLLGQVRLLRFLLHRRPLQGGGVAGGRASGGPPRGTRIRWLRHDLPRRRHPVHPGRAHPGAPSSRPSIHIQVHRGPGDHPGSQPGERAAGGPWPRFVAWESAESAWVSSPSTRRRSACSDEGTRRGGRGRPWKRPWARASRAWERISSTECRDRPRRVG